MSSTNEDLPENKRMYLKLLLVLERLTKSNEYAAEKLTNMELRQCLTEGEGTDAARFVHDWVRAKSASISAKHIDALTRIANLSSESTEDRGDALSYNEMFYSKDERR